MSEKWEVTVVGPQVYLTIGTQRFSVGPVWDEEDEADMPEWYAKRLREAMNRLSREGV